jgi:hypothetical protein
MNSPAPHLDPEALLRLLDERFPDAASEAHLDCCAVCRDRLAAFSEAARDYDTFHRTVLKPTLPAPPKPWEPLVFPPIRTASRRPARWLLAAAAVAALAIAVRLLEHPAPVRAAMLLRKAAAAELAAPPSHRRIQIRTKAGVFDRDARVQRGPETASVTTLHAVFDAAGYPWDNPLSAEAFLHWRASLADPQDDVEETTGVYILRTVARQGPLSDAALSLRASDLHAFACTLRFRSGGEVIYMIETPAATPPAPKPAPAAVPGQNQHLVLRPTVAPTAGDELHVVAALHGIGADLGEPIEIERNSAIIVVRVSGLDENRRGQIRQALSGLIFVMLQFEAAGSNDAKPPASTKAGATADRPNPLIGDLVNHLGGSVSASDLRDQLIDATDRAAQRAFALRTLARRFPSDVTPQLSPADTALLSRMLLDHTNALINAMREIRPAIAPILPNAASPGGSGTTNWQTTAERLPAAVDRLDRSLNGATDSSDARKAQLAQLIADLDRLVTSLRTGISQ